MDDFKQFPPFDPALFAGSESNCSAAPRDLIIPPCKRVAEDEHVRTKIARLNAEKLKEFASSFIKTQADLFPGSEEKSGAQDNGK
jgi:hypothetical protein